MNDQTSLMPPSVSLNETISKRRKFFFSFVGAIVVSLFVGGAMGVLLVQQQTVIATATCKESTNSSGQAPKGTYWFLNLPNPSFVITAVTEIPLNQLPKQWDWRDINGVNLITNVGNQMLPHGCGSCWAFAATRALSDRIKIQAYQKHKKVPTDVILSVQVLLDCGHRSGFGSCYGGDPRFAYKWIHENGIVDETCSPYIAASPSFGSASTTCAESQCHTCSSDGICTFMKNPKKYFVSEYGSFHASNPADFEREVMNEVYNRGPVVVSMNSLSTEFRTFKGGYILQDNKEYHGTTHDVVIIGWGESRTGLKFWIVRNSFGTNWGENGFFRVERGVNTYNLEIQGTWAVPKYNF